MSLLQIIKEQLLQVIENIDTGNSNITDDEAVEILDMLKNFTDKEVYLSKYQAAEYLHVSRATFDNLIREGKLPKGIKQQGFKELAWLKKDLVEYNTNKNFYNTK